MFKIEAQATGPLFDEARIKAVTQRMITTSERELAAEGVKLVKRRLDVVLKHPTGYYRSRVRFDSFGSFFEVHDSKVIYGGWLERGRWDTRFRGYGTFRKVLHDLDSVSVQVLERTTIPRMITELGG